MTKRRRAAEAIHALGGPRPPPELWPRVRGRLRQWGYKYLTFDTVFFTCVISLAGVCEATMIVLLYLTHARR